MLRAVLDGRHHAKSCGRRPVPHGSIAIGGVFHALHPLSISGDVLTAGSFYDRSSSQIKPPICKRQEKVCKARAMVREVKVRGKVVGRAPSAEEAGHFVPGFSRASKCLKIGLIVFSSNILQQTNQQKIKIHVTSFVESCRKMHH